MNKHQQPTCVDEFPEMALMSACSQWRINATVHVSQAEFGRWVDFFLVFVFRFCPLQGSANHTQTSRRHNTTSVTRAHRHRAIGAPVFRLHTPPNHQLCAWRMHVTPCAVICRNRQGHQLMPSQTSFLNGGDPQQPTSVCCTGHSFWRVWGARVWVPGFTL